MSGPAVVLVLSLATPVLLACRATTAGAAPAWRAPEDPCAAAEVADKASRAQALVREKKFAEGETVAKEALAACPTHSQAAPALGDALVAQKKYDEAVERMTTVIQSKADLAHAYFWRAQAYHAKKQPDRMVQDFEAFLRLAPNAPEAPTVRQILASFR
jgi:tetratricopeptide (TPR) repeat protein